MFNPSTFTAVVITSNSGSGAVTVARESYGTSRSADVGMNMQGIVVSHTMANFLGFKEHSLPQPGSRVLCVENTATSCFVIGILPWENLGYVELPARTSLGAGSAIADKANRVGHEENTGLVYDTTKSGDVVDGEYVVSNEFGVLLGLFQQFASLKASELAQIQCFLLDDLVRIVSHNFQHYTALGEFSITHDGKRLMAEFGATHKPAESYGIPAITTDRGQDTSFKKGGGDAADDSSDYYSITGDEQKKAIERFKIFLGSVGDFLNLFIVRPNPNGDATNQIPDTGLANIHAGVDGGLSIRSRKEIFIEKTNWIRVPKRIAAPEDPQGDDASVLDYEPKKSFRFDKTYKNKLAQQIRDYVAYVNQKTTYQNFKSHKRDFLVNDKIDKEFDLAFDSQLDQETPESGVMLSGTAGIYLMPNGGITIRDAFDSAIVMEHGHIYLQAAKDLHVQPSRDCAFKVGQNLSLAAHAHVDISASTGGLRLKSKQAMYFHSMAGGIVLDATLDEDAPEVAYLPEQNPDKVPVEEYEVLKDGKRSSAKEKVPHPLAVTAGIIFKTNRGIYNFAKKLVSKIDGDIYYQVQGEVDTTAKSIVNYGHDSIFNISDKSLQSYTPGSAGTIADGAAFLSGSQLALGEKGKPVTVAGAKLKGVLKINKWKRQAKIKKFMKSRKDLMKYTLFKKPKKKGPDGKPQKPPQEYIKFRFLKTSAYNLDIESDFISIAAYQQAKKVASAPTPQEEADAVAEKNSAPGQKKKKKAKAGPFVDEAINDSRPYPGKQGWGTLYLVTQGFNNLEPIPGSILSKHTEVDSKASPPLYEKADSQNMSKGLSVSSLDSYEVIGQAAQMPEVDKEKEEEEEEDEKEADGEADDEDENDQDQDDE